VNLSLAQISAGKIDESREAIKKAAELNPANAGMAYFNLGRDTGQSQSTKRCD
jgi:hypothetical protein